MVAIIEVLKILISHISCTAPQETARAAYILHEFLSMLA